MNWQDEMVESYKKRLKEILLDSKLKYEVDIYYYPDTDIMRVFIRDDENTQWMYRNVIMNLVFNRYKSDDMASNILASYRKILINRAMEKAFWK